MHNNPDNPDNLDTSYNLDQITDQMAEDLTQYFQTRNIRDPLIVGIHTAGVWLARNLHERLNLPGVIGELNICLFHGRLQPR